MYRFFTANCLLSLSECDLRSSQAAVTCSEVATTVAAAVTINSPVSTLTNGVTVTSPVITLTNEAVITNAVTTNPASSHTTECDLFRRTGFRPSGTVELGRPHLLYSVVAVIRVLLLKGIC